MTIQELHIRLAEAEQDFDNIESALFDEFFDGFGDSIYGAIDTIPNMIPLKQAERRIAQIKAQIAAIKRQSKQAAKEAQIKLF